MLDTEHMKTPRGESLVAGVASVELIVSNTPLSFMGGVDPKTGTIIDQLHPLCGRSLQNHILAIPFGRGSCSGSGVILELLLKGLGPTALVFTRPEPILTLGVLVAKILFSKAISVIQLDEVAFSLLQDREPASISEEEMWFGHNKTRILLSPWTTLESPKSKVLLTKSDKEILAGQFGKASQIALEVILHFAAMQAAGSLVSISQAHVDACYYVGPSTLLFVEELLSKGARFAIPTTLNAISVDQRRWKELGTDPLTGAAASRVADAYMDMGAKMSFTCAPYLLESKPKKGEQIGWAESNAVVFANSVLGARTQKYPDFLDVFIGITGRAPFAGCHMEEGRKPTRWIQVTELKEVDDSLWPILGHCIGEIVGSDIPLVSGLQALDPAVAELKAFCAAFATTSASPMCHMEGITPEAPNMLGIKKFLEPILITSDDLRNTWRRLNSASDTSVSLVSLGNPHFSVEEFTKLAVLCHSRQRHPATALVVTTSRNTYSKAKAAGDIHVLEAFGAEVITDTCWCMINEPIIPIDTRNLMTNSAKYAHYAPGMVLRGVHFGSLADCVDAACAGERIFQLPSWLSSHD